ncbi:MAG: hypothetical protein QOE98_1872 [Gaiellaceae bacterium]|nr:hypothetical protein [Gaiellaceae bacterium]
MRGLVALVLAAAIVTGCGDEGDKAASTAASQPAPSPSGTLPTAPGQTTSTAPTATADVAPPDAIGRLAASFTGQLLVRQKKDVGLGPLACRDLAGSAGCIQLLSGGGACSSRFKAGNVKDRPDEFLATCVGGQNAWHCEVDLQYFADGDRAGQAAYRDSCPAPDDVSGKRLEAMLALAQAWQVDPTAPPATTGS